MELATSDSAPSAAWWRGALIGAAALALALGTLVLIWLLVRPLALLFAAIALAEALTPLVTRLEARMSRVLAIGLIYLSLLLILLGFGWIVVPLLVDQGQQFADELPDLLQRVQARIDRWDAVNSQQIIDEAERNAGRFSGALIGLPFAIVSSLLQLLLVLFMSAYWLLSAPALGQFVRRMVPTESVPKLDGVLAEMRASVGGYVRGEVIDAAAVGALTFTGLFIIGVEYAIVLGLIAAIGELIPVIGPILAGIPAVLVALIESPTQALIVLIFYVGLQQVESNILVPHTMNQTADVPPLLAILALYAGGTLGGILGALIAIPLAGALKVLMVRVVAPAMRNWSMATPRTRAAGDEPSGGSRVTRRPA